MTLKLSRLAWALLDALHRAEQAGRKNPAGHLQEYAELHENGLIERVAGRVSLTHKGNAALLQRPR